ncbi:MAG: hypothetical protein OXE54_02465 [Gammaproteobacteria bacterium]|nr:hypothetical protein [Gammaproteobacteria bacterium]
MSRPKDHFLIVGGGGREASFALNLARDSIVSAFVTHRNPTIVGSVESSGGTLAVGDVRDAEAVARFALEAGVDYAFVSADDPLANGVVDALRDAGVKTVGATQAASRIEWDKIYAMELMRDVAPEFTPFFEIVGDPGGIEPALRQFQRRGLEVVVKPQGLTGGKGVKVMPEHLRDYADCAEYARELLATRPGERVLLVEKLIGIEFTIMGLTDGKNLAMAPASYDYPFRFENDTGPGTGGMGCFTAADKKLPFLSDADIDDCEVIMRRVLDGLDRAGARFNGVLNGGFFSTANGIRFMEFNSRFGDPEGLNILSILGSPFADVLRAIHSETISADSVAFIREASVIKYLVAAEYPNRSPAPFEFTVDLASLREMGLHVLFGAAELIEDDRFTTLGSSRVLAIGATAADIASASDRVNQGIERCVAGNLQYRADIGAQSDIDRLIARGAQWSAPPTSPESNS